MDFSDSGGDWFVRAAQDVCSSVLSQGVLCGSAYPIRDYLGDGFRLRARGSRRRLSQVWQGVKPPSPNGVSLKIVGSLKQ